MSSLPEQIQAEIARLKSTIQTTKELLPGVQVNWASYEKMIAEAGRAVREQDTAAMLRILPELREME